MPTATGRPSGPANAPSHALGKPGAVPARTATPGRPSGSRLRREAGLKVRRVGQRATEPRPRPVRPSAAPPRRSICPFGLIFIVPPFEILLLPRSACLFPISHTDRLLSYSASLFAKIPRRSSATGAVPCCSSLVFRGAFDVSGWVSIALSLPKGSQDPCFVRCSAPQTVMTTFP